MPKILELGSKFMKSSLRVAHIFNELRFSGAEMLVSSAAPQLNEFGDHTVISTGEYIGEYAPTLMSQGINVAHMQFRKSPSYFMAMWKFLMKGGFDVVHVHAERASFWHCLVALAAGKKCIRTIHNTFLFEGFLRFRRSAERRLLNLLGVAQIACSERVVENELKRFGSKTRLISNWFDPRRVSLVDLETRSHLREKWGFSEQDFVIVSVGNSGPAKNHQAIVDCVADSGDELGLRYIHCGAESPELRARVDEVASPRIKLLGSTSAVNEFLAISDAFVCTSFYEGGQISLLEAGAAGCLCITTRVGLAGELSGQDALVFIEPNAESLVEALKVVTKADRSALRSSGENLSKYVRENFGPEKGAQSYRRAYEDILRLPKNSLAKYQ